MKRVLVGLLLLAMSVSVVACGSGGNDTGQNYPTDASAFAKPSVSNVPSGWELTSDDTDLRLIEYTAPNGDFIQIYYDPVQGGTSYDGDYLISLAEDYAIFTPSSTGTTSVNGHLAGYASLYDSTWEWWEKEIVFVNGGTLIDIYTLYEAVNEDEANELINSIY